MTDRSPLDDLLDVGRAVPLAKVDPASLDEPGVSAIWCRLEGVADLFSHTGHLISALVFVGAAGGLRAGRPSRQMLGDRLRQHVHGNMSSSTLRKSVGALLLRGAESEGLRLRRAELEQMVTDWVTQHFLVTWSTLSAHDVDAVRGEAVARFRPPLNAGGDETEFSALLRSARRRLPQLEGDLRRPPTNARSSVG